MQLNGSQSDKFSDALRDAFTLAGFDRMLFYKLNVSREDYSVRTDLQQIVFDVIGAFNREYTIDKLVLAAREAAPNNALLFSFAQQFGLGSTRKNRQELERIIKDANSFLNPVRFREQLGLQEQRVCRVELTIAAGISFGTGFLVGSSTILTNYHVIRGALPPAHKRQTPAPKVDAIARFDYKRIQDSAGNIVRTNEGRLCRFADDWLVDFSINTPDGEEVGPDQLDYALIRLAEPAADDVVDGNANPADPLRRGFIDIPATSPPFEKGSSLFILQHPKGGPLQLALDTGSVLGRFDNDMRVRYTTNTEPGSSGSPCFTPQWDLAALHHSGDPDFDLEHKPTYNEGIPIALVVAMIQSNGYASSLGKQLD